jgi:hypothetical protein
MALCVNAHCSDMQVRIWTAAEGGGRNILTPAPISPFTTPQPHLESKENVANFNPHEARTVLPSTNPKLPVGVDAFPLYPFLPLYHSHIRPPSHLTCDS